MNATQLKGMAFTALAVILAGLVLKYGEDLPVIKDARDGFGG